MKRLQLIIFSLLTIATTFSARAYDSLAFHCESDTVVINELLREDVLKDMEPAKRVAFFAKKLVGAPSNLKAEILESDTAIFTVDIHSFNPLSLVSTCIALSQAYETSSSPNWRDFAEKYEGIMYKSGKAGDFASRFLYPSDWIADNIFRGNITDATQRIDGLSSRRKEKSIDYISHHRDSFKALADSSNYERIKMLEMGFRNHQIPYISNGDLTNSSRFKPNAKDGDIFFLLAPDIDLDSRVMGILFWEGNDLKIISVSYPNEKVTIEDLPFEQYVKRNIKRIQGARIIRVQ